MGGYFFMVLMISRTIISMMICQIFSIKPPPSWENGQPPVCLAGLPAFILQNIRYFVKHFCALLLDFPRRFAILRDRKGQSGTDG